MNPEGLKVWRTDSSPCRTGPGSSYFPNFGDAVERLMTGGSRGEGSKPDPAVHEVVLRGTRLLDLNRRHPVGCDGIEEYIEKTSMQAQAKELQDLRGPLGPADHVRLLPEIRTAIAQDYDYVGSNSRNGIRGGDIIERVRQGNDQVIRSWSPQVLERGALIAFPADGREPASIHPVDSRVLSGSDDADIFLATLSPDRTANGAPQPGRIVAIDGSDTGRREADLASGLLSDALGGRVVLHPDQARIANGTILMDDAHSASLRAVLHIRPGESHPTPGGLIWGRTQAPAPPATWLGSARFEPRTYRVRTLERRRPDSVYYEAAFDADIRHVGTGALPSAIPCEIVRRDWRPRIEKILAKREAQEDRTNRGMERERRNMTEEKREGTS